jgi:hypothetical protein
LKVFDPRLILPKYAVLEGVRDPCVIVVTGPVKVEGVGVVSDPTLHLPI